MKKLSFIIVGLLIFNVASIAQEKDSDLEKYLRRSDGIYQYSNVLKVNTLAIAFSNVSLTYERAIAPRLSFLISAGYKYTGSSPKMFKGDSENIEASIDKITGFSIAPELRYYLKTCEPRFLEGFYIGLYGRYTNYGSGVKFNYFPDDDKPQEFYNADVSLTEVGAGIQLGYQLVIWKRFNIDFMFFGPRYSNYNLVYEFDKEVSQEFLDDLTLYINDVIDRFGLEYEVDIKQSGESRASNSFSFANMRFGISFGFAF